MKKGKFRLIIYLISFTAVITVGIQVYRNIQNYQLNRARLINDVQLALDTGVEGYYADLAKKDIISFRSRDTQQTVSIRPATSGTTWLNVDSLRSSGHFMNRVDRDSSGLLTISAGGIDFPDSIRSLPLNRISDVSLWNVMGSDTLDNFRNFTNQIIFSLTRDTVDFGMMQSFVDRELQRSGLGLPYDLIHYRHDTITGQLNPSGKFSNALSAVARSTFLPRDQKLEMRFADASIVILRRGMTDLLISLLISVCVVGSLLYLYRIINQQKELAEVKNDLISNITHEFKTPIATITTAIDGIVNFNEEKDQKKTDKYLEISSNQLTKLNHMVEKLLETATLDSDKLMLTMEEVDVIEMLDGLSDKYQLIAKNKNVNFHTDFPSKVVEADLFHLENAVSNLIDNAVKYGGKNIDIKLAERDGKTEIKVVDDGRTIEKNQRERIFEKFYRVPTGNRHDVKGFGIGLYYAKKIIEKHGGSILLNLESNKTSFEIAF